MSNATDQIEIQAEGHRSHISELIDELRYRVTPGEVMDQVLGWDDGQEIARTFGRQIRDNPLPLALIGTGVAWLMFSDGTRRPGVRTDVTAAAAEQDGNGRAYVGAPSDTVGDTSGLADTAQSAYGRTKDMLNDAAGSVTGTASAALDKTTDIARSTADTVTQAGSGITRIAHDQPLLAAGIGLAVGIALGAILPMTEAENELLGEQSDAMRQKAGDLAGEGYEKAKAVAQRSYEAAADAAKDEAQHQGLTREPATGQESATAPQSDSRHIDGGSSDGSGFGGDSANNPYGHH